MPQIVKIVGNRGFQDEKSEASVLDRCNTKFCIYFERKKNTGMKRL